MDHALLLAPATSTTEAEGSSEIAAAGSVVAVDTIEQQKPARDSAAGLRHARGAWPTVKSTSAAISIGSFS